MTDGDILKAEEVTKKSWNVVYVWMLYKKTRGEYLDRYADIMRDKSK